MITVAGANLTSAGTHPGTTDGDLLCRFGGSGGKVVKATPVLGSDAVQCVAPANPRQDPGKEVSRQPRATVGVAPLLCEARHLRRSISWIKAELEENARLPAGHAHGIGTTDR